MNFTAADVKTLRERTGCGMMDCKKALTESEGDMDKAAELLREKGMATAAKKAGRIAAEGLVDAFISQDGKTGVLVEVNSETDFVAKNIDFKNFTADIARTVAENSPKNMDELMNAKAVNSDMSVAEALREKILVIGENITIRRFYMAKGVVFAYVHSGGRIGVLAEFEVSGNVLENNEFGEFAKDICMQIAAMGPRFLSADTVPQDLVEEEKSVLVAQIKNDDKLKNKPEQVIAKMVEGRLGKFYEANCLMEQLFVKDTAMTVLDYINSKAKEFGGSIKVSNFTRFEKGEGLQKRDDDFASEVAGMIK